MATKAEAEQAIRHLATEWARESGYVGRAGFYPSFVEFRAWLEAGHYSHYLDFRSNTDPLFVAEGWFEDELRQRDRLSRSREQVRGAALHRALTALSTLRSLVRQAEYKGRGSREALDLAATIGSELEDAGADQHAIAEAKDLVDRAHRLPQA